MHSYARPWLLVALTAFACGTDADKGSDDTDATSSETDDTTTGDTDDTTTADTDDTTVVDTDATDVVDTDETDASTPACGLTSTSDIVIERTIAANSWVNATRPNGNATIYSYEAPLVIDSVLGNGQTSFGIILTFEEPLTYTPDADTEWAELLLTNDYNYPLGPDAPEAHTVTATVEGTTAAFTAVGDLYDETGRQSLKASLGNNAGLKTINCLKLEVTDAFTLEFTKMFFQAKTEGNDPLLTVD